MKGLSVASNITWSVLRRRLSICSGNSRILLHKSPTNIDLQSKAVDDLIVKDDFITVEEESKLLKEVHVPLKRLRYERDHWDDAIHDYRETEKQEWTADNRLIIDRIRQFAFSNKHHQLSYVHVLDLAKDGFIKPHIDSARYCGAVIAGISILSDSVMRLVHEKEKDCIIDVLLKSRSLYVLRGFARFNFTHEILKSEESFFGEQKVPRDRRISVICRCLPEND